MTTDQVKILLTINNHQCADSGEPPTIDANAKNVYTSYFENQYHEQWVFQYNTDTEEGFVWGGDLGWENKVKVVDGHAVGYILNKYEQAWLDVCWATARNYKGARTARRKKATQSK